MQSLGDKYYEKWLFHMYIKAMTKIAKKQYLCETMFVTKASKWQIAHTAKSICTIASKCTVHNVKCPDVSKQYYLNSTCNNGV